jgi:hypothetical protein
MEYSPTGWVAAYEQSSPSDVAIRVVEQWNSDGEALVVDEGRARLVSATDMPSFKRLEMVGRLTAVIPSLPGWTLRIWGDEKDDESAFDEPIVAWLVNEAGYFTPVSASVNPGSEESFLSPLGSQRSAIIAPSTTT